MESSWISFWNNPDIYRQIRSDFKYKFAKLIFERLLILFDNRTNINILDFGCGDATMANWIVKTGHNLYLYDVSKHYLTKAQEKFSNERNITIVDPDSYNSITNQSIDMVIVSSVTQYLTNLQFKTEMKRWVEILKRGGIVILCDVVPPSSNFMSETLSLFFSSIKHNFVFGFLQLVLLRSKPSRCRTLRKSLHLYKYSKKDIEELASSFGLIVSEHYENIGLFSSRKTYILTK